MLALVLGSTPLGSPRAQADPRPSVAEATSEADASTAPPAAPARWSSFSRDRFETEVRPVLLEHCSHCHGPDDQRSGLRVDHGEFLRAGGDRGPAIEPGAPDASRLIRAIEHTEPNLPMPRDGDALPRRVIQTLRAWIRAGAPWPAEPVPAAGAAPRSSGFDLEQRRAEHWAWQPVADPKPPTAPAGFESWPRNEIDAFILARLAAAGLEPSPPADRATWLRRVSLDLTGMPPTLAELEAYLADPAADLDADANVVDRLLASRRYAEHQARRWLDLVRYAETLGHEFDFPIPNAWRYRDYVIRAFAADVGHDRLIREHVAGDLIAPRRDPETGDNEALIGPGFFWFGDQTHSPVDSRKHLADRIDNQIDVTSKAFLGLTVACARCHDHKFDAIPTADYYSWFGILESSRYRQAEIDPAGDDDGRLAHLDAIRGSLVRSTVAGYLERIDEFSSYATAVGKTLDRVEAARRAHDEGEQKRLAAHDADGGRAADRPKATKFDRGQALESTMAAVAAEHALELDRLRRFVRALTSRTARDQADHPAHALARAIHGEAKARPARTPGAAGYVFADFARDGYDGFHVDGRAFGNRPTDAGTAVPLDAEPDRVALQVLDGTYAHSGAESRRLTGALRSRSFTIRKRFIHVYACGQEARINVCLDGFSLIRDPIYGRFKRFLGDPRPGWYTIDAGQWRGRSAWLEFVDTPAPDPADPHRKGGYDPRGWIAVRQVVFSDDGRPPSLDSSSAAHRPTPSAELEVDSLAAALERAARRAVQRYARTLDHGAGDGQPTGDESSETIDLALLDWLGRHALLDDSRAAARYHGRGLGALRREYGEVDAAIDAPRLAPSMTEGTPTDAPLLVRGSVATPGDPVPRRFLQALGGEEIPPAGGSGRRLLADRIADPDNPLTARVAVNRAWHYLFGRGLVATVDNFGVLGERPSHPALLDWLARRFVEDDWSWKRALRRIALSATYRMSSRPVTTPPRAAVVAGARSGWSTPTPHADQTHDRRVAPRQHARGLGAARRAGLRPRRAGAPDVVSERPRAPRTIRATRRRRAAQHLPRGAAQLPQPDAARIRRAGAVHHLRPTRRIQRPGPGPRAAQRPAGRRARQTVRDAHPRRHPVAAGPRRDHCTDWRWRGGRPNARATPRSPSCSSRAMRDPSAPTTRRFGKTSPRSSST